MTYKYKRNMDLSTKQKISQKLKGRSHSDQTKKRISDTLKRIWSTIPKDPEKQNNKDENVII